MRPGPDSSVRIYYTVLQQLENRFAGSAFVHQFQGFDGLGAAMMREEDQAAPGGDQVAFFERGTLDSILGMDNERSKYK